MNNWFKDNKLLAIITMGILIGMTVYMFFGHSAIRAAYDGTSFDIVNRAIEGQAEYPLDYYYNKGDRLVFRIMLPLIVASFYFIFFLSKGLSKSGERVVLGLFALTALIVFLVIFRKSVADDVYIIFRFSRNLAQGHGLVWNVSGSAEEGYTSFLWVIINTIPHLLNFDPLIFSRTITIVALLGTVALLILSCKTINKALAAIFIAALVLNPMTSALTMLGLETMLAAFLLLLSAYLARRILLSPSKKEMSLLFGIFLLSFFTRPDTAVFNTGIFLGIITVFILNRNYRAMKDFFIAGLPFIVPGIIYIAWRVDYFGKLFPNTFYVKGRGDTWIKQSGMANVAYFYRVCLRFYIITVGTLLLVSIERFLTGKDEMQKLKNNAKMAFPALLGSALFIFYLTTIYPMANYFHRFAFPVYPAILFCMICLLSGLTFEFLGEKRKKIIFAATLVFTLWATGGVRNQVFAYKNRAEGGYRPEARKLAGLNGTMFVSESGAVPYFSGWKSLDLWGLTSKEIACDGLTIDILENLDPDLVMVIHKGRYSVDLCWKEGDMFKNRENPRIVLDTYMRENNFLALAAIRLIRQRRAQRSGVIYYFARKDSKLFEEIVQALESVRNPKYMDLDKFMGKSEIPLYILPLHEEIAVKTGAEVDNG